MKDDPKQIVTPYAFEVDPNLLGLPLATPKRRLLALILDLFIAAILTSLGNILLAIMATGIFVWMAVRTKSENKWKNYLRYTGAAAASLIIFGLTLGLLEATKSDSGIGVDARVMDASGEQTINWKQFNEDLKNTDFSDQGAVEALANVANKLEENILQTPDSLVRTAQFDSVALSQLIALQRYASLSDSIRRDSLRTLVAANIAAPELSELEIKNRVYSDRIKSLDENNAALQEKVDNPGIIATLRSTAEDFGLTIGWMGLYFIITLAVFKGQTLGKKLLKLRVLRLNNEPISLWYSFERFGGYAAGLATGLLGFFEIFWDANRQGIHDKIARTVVIDERESRKKKVMDLSQRVIKEANLLED